LNGFSSLRVAVNISANQLRDVKFLDNIKAALDKTQFDPRSLAVEITESEAMQNINIAAHILKTLSDWGVLILLDDFGKEYSSLNTLKVLPVDIVKIDKSFLINIPHNQQNASLVSTMITMAHNLGKEILAEGVENMEQLSFLMNNNCNYAQGYYFAKPMPIEHLQDILVSSGGHIYK
ncbi:MAG TPA: EAL domain-containing protein, partial [Desulfohalobiaceae bacterium]|nr:EAL domain-containing protein [Desulfohalobiaceae bacterium]